MRGLEGGPEDDGELNLGIGAGEAGEFGLLMQPQVLKSSGGRWSLHRRMDSGRFCVYDGLGALGVRYFFPMHPARNYWYDKLMFDVRQLLCNATRRRIIQPADQCLLI